MTSFPWLTVIGAIPLVGALVIAIIPAASSDDKAVFGPRDLLTKQIALVTSLVTLGMTVAMAVKFSPNGPAFQFVEIHQWIPEFGVHYAVGVDGIALVLIGMTAVLMPVVILASWHDADPAEPGDTAAAGAASSGPTPRSAGSGPTTPRSASSGPTTPPKRSVKAYFALMLVLETMVIG